MKVTIPLLILDVDGVLTDGKLAPAPEGDTEKTFSSQDGFAMKLWQRLGRKIALVSGRHSTLVNLRAKELGVELVFTGSDEKLAAFDAVLAQTRVPACDVAYVGDDLPDLPVIKRVGVPLAVANAHRDVKRAALYVSQRRGGQGAVAELIEWLLRLDGTWQRERGSHAA